MCMCICTKYVREWIFQVMQMLDRLRKEWFAAVLLTLALGFFDFCVP